MKFRISVKYLNADSAPWWEDYDKPEVRSQAEAEAWGRDIIEWFNGTLHPGEKPREFVSAEIGGGGSTPHDYQKTNSGTLEVRGLIFDTYKCAKCKVTGRRYGLNDWIDRDPKFKAAKYEFCLAPSAP